MLIDRLQQTLDWWIGALHAPQRQGTPVGHSRVDRQDVQVFRVQQGGKWQWPSLPPALLLQKGLYHTWL